MTYHLHLSDDNHRYHHKQHQLHLYQHYTCYEQITMNPFEVTVGTVLTIIYCNLMKMINVTAVTVEPRVNLRLLPSTKVTAVVEVTYCNR